MIIFSKNCDRIVIIVKNLIEFISNKQIIIWIYPIIYAIENLHLELNY